MSYALGTQVRFPAMNYISLLSRDQTETEGHPAPQPKYTAASVPGVRAVDA
jgi:hypothetical protein